MKRNKLDMISKKLIKTGNNMVNISKALFFLIIIFFIIALFL